MSKCASQAGTHHHRHGNLFFVGTLFCVYLLAACLPLKEDKKKGSTGRTTSKIPNSISHGDDTAVVNFSDITVLTGAGTWTNRYWVNFEGGAATADNSFIVKDAGLNHIEVPRFELSDLGVGGDRLNREAVVRQIVEGIAARFGQLDVSFSTAQPAKGNFSTLHIGGRDFRGKAALGVAPLDIDNFSNKDIGFAFADELNPSRPAEQNIQILINAAAHEVAHSLGAEHISNPVGIMNPVVDTQNNTFQGGRLVSRGGEQNSFEVMRTNIGLSGAGDMNTLPTLLELAVYTQGEVSQVTIYTDKNVKASNGLNLGRYEYTWKLPSGEAKGSSIRVPTKDIPASIKIVASNKTTANPTGTLTKEFNLSAP